MKLWRIFNGLRWRNRLHEFNRLTKMKSFLTSFSARRMKTMSRVKRSRPKMLCCCGASERLTAIPTSTFRTSPTRGVLVWASMRSFTHIDRTCSTSTRCSRAEIWRTWTTLLMLPIESLEFQDCWMPKIWLNRADPTNGKNLNALRVFGRFSFCFVFFKVCSHLRCFVLSHVRSNEEWTEERQTYRQHRW